MFGQFVGAWDLRVRFFDESAQMTYDDRGEWSFGWVLDGRTLQDVLAFPDPETGGAAVGERRIGTTIRQFLPSSRTWSVTWIGAVSGVVHTSSARRVSEEIWIEATEDDGSTVRAVFSDITSAAFRWESLISPGGGTSWRREQEILASRRTISAK